MIGIEFGRRSAPHHAALLDEGVAVAQRDQPFDVLVDHQHGLAGGAQRGEALPDLLAHQRCQPLGRFVEDQQAWVGHQRPTDGEHLLLAAGKPSAEVAGAVGQPREERIDPVERPRLLRFATVGGEGDEVLLHRQVGKDLAALGHQRQAHARDAVGRQPVDALAEESDGTCRRRRQAHDRAYRRRLAHAVAAEQARRFAGADCQVEAEQHLAVAVARLEAGDFEQRRHASSPR